MADDRFVVAQFCDDIRQEVGNKYSLMGCYFGDLLLPTFPITIPKLCAEVKVFTPLNWPFERLSIRLLRDDVQVAEMTIDNAAALVPAINVPGARWNVDVAFLQMSPFGIEAPGTLRVEAETERGVIKSGGLRIMQLEIPPIPPATASA